MCDGGGPNLHTRLVGARTRRRRPKSSLVHDAFAHGRSTTRRVRSRRARERWSTSRRRAARPRTRLTVIGGRSDEDDDGSGVAVPGSTADDQPTTTTTKPTTGTTTTTDDARPPAHDHAVGGPGDPGGRRARAPVVGPGVVVVGASVAARHGRGEGRAAGTLPFTGSDIRAFARARQPPGAHRLRDAVPLAPLAACRGVLQAPAPRHRRLIRDSDRRHRSVRRGRCAR